MSTNIMQATNIIKASNKNNCYNGTIELYDATRVPICIKTMKNKLANDELKVKNKQTIIVGI